MKTNRNYFFGLIWFACTMTITILGSSFNSIAQTDNKNRLIQMIRDDATTIDAIAGADVKVQNNILQITLTPEVLDKLAELQKRSESRFRSIIQDYNREEQTAFYDLARYPNLISELVRNGRSSPEEAYRIASNYPEEIRGTAVKYGSSYSDVLVRIVQLNNAIDMSFQQYLEPYDARTRESVKVLLAYPEIVTTLVEDMSFTSLLGTVYNEDPEWVINQLNRISHDLAEQNREDLDSYKSQIQQDPQAYNELLDASERYARENNDMRRYDRYSDPAIVLRINSYPYWFGYPYWYSTPIWRPYPISYHTGFYRNNFGNIVFVGLPSFNFLHWQTHYHPGLFPHLSYNYYNFYQDRYVNRQQMNRPAFENGFYRSIRNNVVNNPRVNNSTLERIDQQRGNHIINQPNTYGSGTSRMENQNGGTYRRESNPTYTAPGNNRSGAGENKRATINDNKYERPKINEGGYRRAGEEPNSNQRRFDPSGSRINRVQSSPVNTAPSQRTEKSANTQKSQNAPAPAVSKPTRSERRAARVAASEPQKERKDKSSSRTK